MHENLWQWLCRMGRVGKLLARRSVQRFVGLLDREYLRVSYQRNLVQREMCELPKSSFAWAIRNCKQECMGLLCAVILAATPKQPNAEVTGR